MKWKSDRHEDHRDICCHEFAHTIMKCGVSQKIRDMIADRYNKSVNEQKLWQNTYAATNEEEFFAELSMWYFGSKGDSGKLYPTPEEGPTWLYTYDKDSFSLLDAIYNSKVDVGLFKPTLLELLPPEKKATTKSSNGLKTTLLIKNETDESFSIFWIDYDGEKKSYGTIFPRSVRDQNTYATHAWLVADSNGTTKAIFIAIEQPCLAIIK